MEKTIQSSYVEKKARPGREGRKEERKIVTYISDSHSQEEEEEGEEEAFDMFSPGQSRVRKGASILNIGTSGSDSPGKECFNEAYSHSPSSSRSPGHFPSSSGKKAGAPSSKFLVNSNSITHQAVASGQNTDMWSNTGRAGCGSNGSPSTTSSLRGQGQGHLAHRTADRTAGSKTVLAASSRANIGRHNLDISIASSNYHEENYQTASKNGLHAGRYTNPRSPESRSPHRHSSSAKRQRKSSHKDGFITSVSANQSSRTPKMKYSRSPRGVASPSSDVTAMATGTASASPNQDIRDQNKGAPLSPMRGYTGRQPSDVRELAVRRSFGQTESAVGKDEEPAAGGTWTGALFSPVLRLFGQDDPEGESPTKTTGNSVNVSPVNAAAAAVEQTQPASVERGNANPRQHAVHAVHAVSRPAAASHVNEHDSENKQQTRDSVEEVEDDEDYEEFNPYFFIKTLPPYKQAVPKPRPFMLPAKARNAPRLMLLLDLDETLVHCSVEPIPNPDLTFPVDFNGTRYEVYVRRRPHFQRFMEVRYL